MDPKNLFHTRATYTLERIDYGIGVALLAWLTLSRAGEVDWGRFAVAFAWIDVVGYLPGLIWSKRAGADSARPPKILPVLYNTTHSFGLNAVVVFSWLLATGSPEWAMLAPAIHLMGDRSLFGNIYKPFGLAFEPARHPLFGRFVDDFARASREVIEWPRATTRAAHR